MQVDEGIRDMAARYFLILYAPMLFRTANIIFGTVLRSVGDTKTPMRVGVVMNIINTVLKFPVHLPDTSGSDCRYFYYAARCRFWN